MPNLSCNDLIGLRYCWGASPCSNSGFTDCFQLASEVHRRLGFGDYTRKFDWVYELYDEATFPKGLLVRWLLQNGTRLSVPRPGAVALLPAAVGSALGTIVEDGALYLSPGGTVIKAPLPADVGHFFWMHE
jgi:hypothetical protein